MKKGRDFWWHEEVSKASPICPPAKLSSEHPLFILYTSGSTGVEDEERMLTAELCRRTNGRCFGDFLMPPEIPSFFHGDLVLCSAKNDHGFNGPGDRLTLDLDLKGIIDICLLYTSPSPRDS